MPDNLRKLYDNVSAEYELPDFETFKLDMSDDVKRQKLYDAIAADYELPDFETFTADMGVKKKEPSEPVSQVGSGAAPTTSTDRDKAIRELTAKAVAGDQVAKTGLERLLKEKQTGTSVGQQVREADKENKRTKYEQSKPQIDAYRQSKEVVGLDDSDLPALEQMFKQAKGGDDYQAAAQVEGALNKKYEQIDRAYIESLRAEQPLVARDRETTYSAIRAKMIAEGTEALSDGEQRFMRDLRENSLAAYYSDINAKMYEIRSVADIDTYNKRQSLMADRANKLVKEAEGISANPVTVQSKKRYEEIKSELQRLNEESQKLAEETGVTPEVLSEMSGLYEKSKALESEASRNSKRFYELAKEDIDERVSKEQRKGESNWSAFKNGLMSSVSQMVTGIPKIIKTDVASEQEVQEYDWVDKLYLWADDMQKTAEQRRGQPYGKEYEAMSLSQRLPYMLGEGAGSLMVFAAGGLAGAPAKLGTLTTIGTAYMTSEPQAYDEAIAAGLDVAEAQTFARAFAGLTSAFEGVMPDFKLIAPSVRSSAIQMIKQGVPRKQALKKALSEYSKEIADAAIKEGVFEEGGAAIAGDVVKEAANAIAGKTVFEDTFDPTQIGEQVLVGAILGGGMKAISGIRSSRSEATEDMILEVAVNGDQIVGDVASIDPEIGEELSEVQTTTSKILQGLQGLPSFDALPRNKKAHILSELDRRQRLEDSMKVAGVKPDSTLAEIAAIEAEVKTILDTGMTPTELSEEANKAKAEPQEAAVEVEMEVKPLESEQVADQVTEQPKRFNIDGKRKFYHASSQKRRGRLKPNQARQFGVGVYFSTSKEIAEGEFGDNVEEVELNLSNPVYTNTKEWNEVVDLALKKANEGKPVDEDGDIIGEETDYYEIDSKFISDAATELGYDAIVDKGSTEYENEIAVLDESKIVYPEDETTPASDTEVDGGIRPTITEGEVGQGGEGVQPAVDVAGGEGKVEVSQPTALPTEAKGQGIALQEQPAVEVTATDGGVSAPATPIADREVKPVPENEFDELEIETEEEAKIRQANEKDYGDEDVNALSTPQALAQSYLSTSRETEGSREDAISQVIGPVTLASFRRFGDINFLTPNMKRRYIRSENARTENRASTMDQIAQEASSVFTGGQKLDAITPEDIYDFMVKYPNGMSPNAPSGNKRLEVIAEKYRDMTGKTLNRQSARAAVRRQQVSAMSAASTESMEAPFQRDDKLIEARANAIREEQKKLVDQRKRVEQSKAKKVKDMSKEAQKEIGNLFDQGVIGDPNSLFQEGIDFSKDNVQSVLNKYNAEIEQINRQLAALQKELDGLGQDSGQLDMFGEPMAQQEGETLFPDASEDRVKEVVDVVNKIASALKQIRPDITSIVYKKDEDFIAAAIAAGMKPGTANTAKSFFDPRTGTLHISASRMSENTPFHEGAHPVLTVLAAENPETIGHFARQVENLRKADGRTYRAWAESGYPGASDMVRDTEILAEFLGDVATGRHADQFGKSWFRELVAWLKSLLGKIGLQQEIDLDSAKDLREFAQRFSEAMRWGVRAHMQFAKTRRSKAYDALMLQDEGDKLTKIDEKIQSLLDAGTTTDAIIEKITASKSAKGIAEVIKNQTGKTVEAYVKDMAEKAEKAKSRKKQSVTGEKRKSSRAERVKRDEKYASALGYFAEEYESVNTEAISDLADEYVRDMNRRIESGEDADAVFEEAFEYANDLITEDARLVKGETESRPKTRSALAVILAQKIVQQAIENGNVQEASDFNVFLDETGRFGGTLSALMNAGLGIDPLANIVGKISKAQKEAMQKPVGSGRKRKDVVKDIKEEVDEKRSEAADQAVESESIDTTVSQVKPRARPQRPPSKKADAKKREKEAIDEIKSIFQSKATPGPMMLMMAAPQAKRLADAVVKLAKAEIELGAYTFSEVIAKTHKKIKDYVSKDTVREVLSENWSDLEVLAAETKREDLVEMVKDAIAGKSSDAVTKALARAIKMARPDFIKSMMKGRKITEKQAIEEIMSNKELADEILRQALSVIKGEVLQGKHLDMVTATKPKDMSQEDWDSLRGKWVVKQFERFVDGVMGDVSEKADEIAYNEWVEADAKDKIDALKEYQKQVKKAVQKIARKYYKEGANAETLAEALVEEMPTLSVQDAINLAQVVESQMRRIIDSMDNAKLKRLVNEMTDGRNESDAMKVLNKAMVSGKATGSFEFANLLSNFLGFKGVPNRVITQANAIMSQIAKMPQGSARNTLLTKVNNLVMPYVETGWWYFDDLINRLIVTNILSSLGTAFTGGLSVFLLTLPRVGFNLITRPAMTTRAVKTAFDNMFSGRQGIGSAAEDTFIRHRMPISRELPKDVLGQPESAWLRTREMAWKEVGNMWRTHRGKAISHAIGKALINATFQGKGIGVANAINDFQVFLDYMNHAFLRDMYMSVEAQREAQAQGISPKDPAFRDFVETAMVASDKQKQEIDQKIADEIQQMNAIGEPIPRNYKDRRRRELMSEMSDAGLLNTAHEKAVSALGMGSPETLGGAWANYVMQQLRFNPKVHGQLSAGGFVIRRLTFPITLFSRMMMVLGEKAFQYTPIWGPISLMFPYTYTTDKDGVPVRKMLPDGTPINNFKHNKDEYLTRLAVSSAITAAFLWFLMNAWDEEEIKDPKTGEPIKNPYDPTKNLVRKRYKYAGYIDFYGDNPLVNPTVRGTVPRNAIRIRMGTGLMGQAVYKDIPMQSIVGMYGVFKAIGNQRDAERYFDEKLIFDTRSLSKKNDYISYLKDEGNFDMFGLAASAGVNAFSFDFSAINRIMDEVKRGNGVQGTLDVLFTQQAKSVVNPRIINDIERQVYRMNDIHKIYIDAVKDDPGGEKAVAALMKDVWFTDPFIYDRENWTSVDPFGFPIEYPPVFTSLVGMFGGTAFESMAIHERKYQFHYNLFRDSKGNYNPDVLPYPKRYILSETTIAGKSVNIGPYERRIVADASYENFGKLTTGLMSPLTKMSYESRVVMLEYLWDVSKYFAVVENIPLSDPAVPKLDMGRLDKLQGKDKREADIFMAGIQKYFADEGVVE